MGKGRILLVEDNVDNLELVRFLLERQGYEILAARNGNQAVEMARSELPDLVLMDLSLPEKDGWTAASELKQDPHTRAIPLVALTAHTLAGDRKRAMQIGFAGYVYKPINLPTLEATIASALAEARKPRQG